MSLVVAPDGSYVGWFGCFCCPCQIQFVPSPSSAVCRCLWLLPWCQLVLWRCFLAMVSYSCWWQVWQISRGWRRVSLGSTWCAFCVLGFHFWVLSASVGFFYPAFCAIHARRADGRRLFLRRCLGCCTSSRCFCSLQPFCESPVWVCRGATCCCVWAVSTSALPALCWCVGAQVSRCLAHCDGVFELRSRTSCGLCRCLLGFVWGDIAFATVGCVWPVGLCVLGAFFIPFLCLLWGS